MMKWPNTFEEWTRTEHGIKCLTWDSCLSTEYTAAQYLRNRAWWAFQAGVKLAPEQMQKTFEWYEDCNRQLKEQIRQLTIENKKLKSVYTFKYKRDGDGYMVYAEEFPYVTAIGKTKKEALESLIEDLNAAITLEIRQPLERR